MSGLTWHISKQIFSQEWIILEKKWCKKVMEQERQDMVHDVLILLLLLLLSLSLSLSFLLCIIIINIIVIIIIDDIVSIYSYTDNLYMYYVWRTQNQCRQTCHFAVVSSELDLARVRHYHVRCVDINRGLDNTLSHYNIMFI